MAVSPRDFQLLPRLIPPGRAKRARSFPYEREKSLPVCSSLRRAFSDRGFTGGKCSGRCAKSRDLAHSARARVFKRDCVRRLQQTPTYSRDRIRKRRGLSLSRSRAVGASRFDARGIEGALLRHEHQRQLSVRPRSAARERSTRLNLPDRWTWAELRHRFVLTPEEKRVITFLIAALLLGVGTKCYRDLHRQPEIKIEKKHSTSRPARGKASKPRD
jgi:hypothetical protein